MKIDFLCNDGSPLKVTMKSLWGEDGQVGIGGSEYAMLTMCEQWANEGHDVTLYNDPRERNASPFEQRAIIEFDPTGDRDILIVFRSPNRRALGAKGKVIWFSCDQHTVGSFSQFSNHVDEIVCISEFHKDYFDKTYGIKNANVIDLPVRVQDFPDEYEKVENRFIFTSVPDRGLQHLHPIWMRIQEDIPSASLVITSDYRLWGSPNPDNQPHRMAWLPQENVFFRGALSRKEYIKEICKAEMFVYPAKADTEELFCVSLAEAQYAGAYPVTSDQGALATTNMGSIIKGDPDRLEFRDKFVGKVKEVIQNRETLSELQHSVINGIVMRCHPEAVSKIWHEKVFNG